ncbi:unnamed protein product [Dicrocoelium dendriticum]|nr:unnamed protein product [Dicrocoelium dendriticum]
MSNLRSWTPSVADSESTQPMVQQAPSIPKAAVPSPNFTDVVLSDGAQTPERRDKSPTLKSATVSRSPVVDDLRCANLPRGYQLDTSKEKQRGFVDESAFLATEATEDYESTQPMVQLHQESFRAVRPSVGALEASQADEDYAKPQPVTESRSPTVDDFTRKSELVTPPIVLSDVDPPSRLVKSTSKRATLREPHVSSVYLSDAIGMVRFRSTRKSNLRHTATLAEFEGSQPGAIKMLQSLENTTGLVRRASQCFPSETPDNRQTVPLRRTAASIMSKRSGKSHVLRIPSPVKLPDSILSDDPSQLNGSPDRSMSKELIVNLEAVPTDSYQFVSSAVNEQPPSGFKPEEAPSRDKGLSESRSAITLAGFEESPDGPGDKLSNASTGRQLLPFSVSVPVVDFSSFSDYVEDHHNSSRSKPVPTRTSLPAPSRKRIVDEPKKSSRMSLQPSGQSIANVVVRPKRSCRTKPLTRDTTSAPLQPLRRSRRSTVRPPTYSTGSSDSSPEPLPMVRKTLNRARRSTVSKPDDGLAAKRRTTSRLRRISSSSELSNRSDTRNPESSRILLKRCDSHSEKSHDIPMRLLFSAVDSGLFTQLLARMGAVETNDYMMASHLITSNEWKRTLKMLHARARGIPIVSVDWLVACKRVRRAPYPDPTQFLLTSPPFGAFRRSSTKSNQRSSHISSDEEGFLQGWSFRSTPTVLPTPTDLARLTDLAGGHWMTDRELSDAVSNLTHRTVVIVADDEFKSLRSGQGARNLKLSRVLATAVKSLPCVPVDWFLNTLMLRKTPSWPVKL